MVQLRTAALSGYYKVATDVGVIFARPCIFPGENP
jgi:hypothetical protein